MNLLRHKIEKAIEETGRGIFLGDNIHGLQAMLKAYPRGIIDLCYIDPPFNSDTQYNMIYPDSDTDQRAASLAFEDVWSQYDFQQEVHGLASLRRVDPQGHEKHESITAYLSCVEKVATPKHHSYMYFMALRMWYIYLLLKDTGSFYLHCDPTMSHYLKQLLDIIFGADHFRNEIVWHYFMGGKSKYFFAKKHDVILFYTKSKDYTLQVPYHQRMLVNPSLKSHKSMQAMPCPSCKKETNIYLSEVLMDDVWDISGVFNWSKEYKPYPTQKPEELLKRIVKASSNKGDLVVDFFAGCGTTARAAEALERRWLAFDVQLKGLRIIEKDAIDSGLAILRAIDKSRYTYEQKKVMVYGIPTTVDQLRDFFVKGDDKLRYDAQHTVIEYCLGGLCNTRGSKGEDGWVTRYVGHRKQTAEYIIEVDTGAKGASIDKLRARIKMAYEKQRYLIFVAERFTLEMKRAAAQEGKIEPTAAPKVLLLTFAQLYDEIDTHRRASVELRQDKYLSTEKLFKDEA